MAISITVAAVQMAPEIAEPTKNTSAMLKYANDAADKGAQLIVFPELATSGYVFKDMEELRQLSQNPYDNGSFTELRALAEERGLHLAFGYPESSNGKFYNSAALIGPDGVIGNYRKLHLWDEENRFFEPGDLGHPVYETPIGKIGMMICYDCWFPETIRSLVLQGAEIVCVPTNWVPTTRVTEDAPDMAPILCQASAHSNGVYIVAADRVGCERGVEFIGQSVITGPAGVHLAGPASYSDNETLIAEVRPSTLAEERQWNSWNEPIKNRRPEAYGLVTSREN